MLLLTKMFIFCECNDTAGRNCSTLEQRVSHLLAYECTHLLDSNSAHVSLQAFSLRRENLAALLNCLTRDRLNAQRPVSISVVFSFQWANSVPVASIFLWAELNFGGVVVISERTLFLSLPLCVE
jgi:hypothetical protein